MRSRCFAEIYRVVRRIPRGRVLSYGDVARLCRGDVSARTVGWAMSVCPPDVPWHRVVNYQGRLTIGRRSLALQQIQRDLLLAEGVTFTVDDEVNMENHRWRPRQRVTNQKREVRRGGKKRPERILREDALWKSDTESIPGSRFSAPT